MVPFSARFRALPSCLLLLACCLVGAALQALGPRVPLAVRPLQTWHLTDGEGALVKSGDQEIRFAPQSFFRAKGGVIFVNRFDPCLVTFADGSSVPGTVMPLSHPADRKFAARFLSDLAVSGDVTYVLEQSTATIRRVGGSGVINGMWLLTGREGAVITRLWPAGPAAFWLHDRGSGMLLRRRCDAPPDPDRDAPGEEFTLTADSLAVGGGRLLTADCEGDTDWALLARDASHPTSGPKLLATFSARLLQVLDVDETGRGFAYLDDEQGPAVLRVAGAGPVERFPLAAPLVFPADAGRVAQAVSDDRLLVLVQPEPDEIMFGELLLK